MSLESLALRHLLRTPGRTLLTTACVALAVLAFLLLRTFAEAFHASEREAAHDRLGTRHKVSFTVHMPRHHVDVVRNVPGVQTATFANWFGVEDAVDRKQSYAGIAVDHLTYLDVYDEIDVSPEDRAAWRADPRSILVGDLLARRLKLRRGDELHVLGRIYPGSWHLRVAGFFTSHRASASRSQFLMRWDYLNEALAESATAWHKDEVGWIVARVIDAPSGPATARAIDERFASGGVPTLTMSESAVQNGFVGMVAAVLRAVDVVAVGVLLVLTLLVGNAIALGIDERSRETAVLRAIGFSRAAIVRALAFEGLAMSVSGGLIGTCAALFFVGGSIGDRVRAELGGPLEYFRVGTPASLEAMALVVVLGIAAAIPPALRATRRPLVDALRVVVGA